MPRKTKASKKTKETTTYLDRLEQEVKSNQSRVSLILGVLIVLVIGILLYNYFNRGQSQVGPSSQTFQTEESKDVAPEKLPGKYTVKEGDTLFLVAEKYYGQGYGDKFTEIVIANGLSSPNLIEVGQILEIPKLEVSPAPSAEPLASPEPSFSATVQPSPASQAQEVKLSPKDTEWGPAITSNTYTVQVNDWLSKIAARAYGDPMTYQRLAQANNIQNPDLIEPGMILKIPR